MSVKAMFDLTGRLALVTGASRGLGLQMTEALGEMGASVAICARKSDELDAAVAQLEAQGIKVQAHVVDLGDGAAASLMVDAVLGCAKPIDILVNNAGASWGAPAAEYPDAAWRKVMSLNVDALFYLTREVGRRCMIPQRSGRIINIASIAGLAGNPSGVETIAYNTSKGAVINFTRALAAEWGQYNINVNAISPGFFRSKMSQGLLDRIEERVIAATPLHRLGGAEDLKGAVVFLASEAARHVTGQNLVVDGGASIC